MFSDGRDDLGGTTTVTSKYLRMEKNDCEDNRWMHPAETICNRGECSLMSFNEGICGRKMYSNMGVYVYPEQIELKDGILGNVRDVGISMTGK